MIKDTSVAAQAHMIVKTANKYHYSPRAVDNQFSELFFESFLQMLDPLGNLFTKKIYTNLKKYRHTLDQQIMQQKTDFLDTVTSLYGQQLQLADSLLQTMLGRKITFSARDTLWLGGDNTYGNLHQLVNKWKKWIKYMILRSHQSQADSLHPASTITKEEVKKTLKEVISIETCRIQSKLNPAGVLRKLTGEIYLKALAATFDPHTNYMSPAEKIQFENQLSTTTASFGLKIHLNIVGEIEIIEILPGGPAWNSNEINEGDIILGIEKANGNTMDLRCTTPSGVSDFLSSIGWEDTNFKIRKKDGKIISVALRKEILEVAENSIQSFLLKNTHTIGYIYLPSFYTDFTYSNSFSPGCANDLAKELIRLRKDSISGLILDLRSNGGGVTQEAIRTVGAFVDRGALCIIHIRGEKPQTRKDKAKGAIYRGPMVVLVNSSSASASEIFAAALQDYNRAIIVGSQTFGKGTSQFIIPVDLGNYDSLSPYQGEPPGFLRLTMGGIYRISGKSHQKNGISPDIELPDLFEKIQTNEAALDGSLELDKITKKVYSYPEPPLPKARLKKLSASRQQRNPAFKYVKRIKPKIPNLNARYAIPLEFRSFKKFYNQYETWEDSLTIHGCSTTVILPHYLESDRTITDHEKEMYQENIDDISVDIYINEAVNIINDLIHQALKTRIKNND